MQSALIRQKFIDYFQQDGHQWVPSSPLVPAGDPTLLFTNAGMVQFKEVFLGQDPRSYARAVTVQKCMRAGGKHNDLDQVGRTARHQTFFEMLGNFSFGDYFKRDAIRFAWGFLTEELELDPRHLWVTVFESDDEAYALWQEVAGVLPERIVRMGAADNFWSMGDTGPCGPSSEIFVDRGPDYACGPDCGLGRCECDRVQEIWNLVFMQYDRDQEGNLTPLPRPSIDTGMGLERLASYLQGVDSNFDTDLLFPLIQEVERLSGKPYQRGPEGMAFRVIADHVRAITFLLAEGVSFSNEGRGYVLRRILRRAVRYGMTLGFDAPFLSRLVAVVGDMMGGAYPEVATAESEIAEAVRYEEERFWVTLESGIKVLNQKLEALSSGDSLSGEDAFLLYDTFGFPLDLTQDAAMERGVTTDQEGFDRLMQAQRERARSNRNRTVETLPHTFDTEFVGYQQLETAGVAVVQIYQGVDPVERLEVGDSGWILLPTTPFYPEGGGQVGDVGQMESESGVADISDTQRSGSSIWHLACVTQGVVTRGQTVTARVNPERREGAMRNHTGTHLLHAALRQVLGAGVHQTGSLVAPDRLRFDFAYPRPMTARQLEEVENLVNAWILDDRPVSLSQMTRDEALQGGALAFFGDKYGEKVRVVTVPNASQELCGGTHCQRTGQIGLFAITDESSVGAGSRRIEAATGWNALHLTRSYRGLVKQWANLMKTSVADLPDRTQGVLDEMRELEGRLAQVTRTERLRQGHQLAQQAEPWGTLKVVVREVEDVDSLETLRLVMDGLKPEVDAAILTARHGGRASLLVYLGQRRETLGLRAGDVVKDLAPAIGGGGGGRGEMGQAGGKRPEGIPELLNRARQWLVENVPPAG